jgi:hypothetical protein
MVRRRIVTWTGCDILTVLLDSVVSIQNRHTSLNTQDFSCLVKVCRSVVAGSPTTESACEEEDYVCVEWLEFRVLAVLSESRKSLTGTVVL